MYLIITEYLSNKLKVFYKTTIRHLIMKLPHLFISRRFTSWFFFYNISKRSFCKKKIIINIDNRRTLRLCVSDESRHSMVTTSSYIERKDMHLWCFFPIVFFKKKYHQRHMFTEMSGNTHQIRKILV